MLRVFVLLNFVLIAFSSKAIDTSQFYHFTTQSGLPSNNIYSVVVDKSGYKWIATDKGVAKYDGYSFTTFTTKEGLPINDVWKLYVDDNNRIWLFSNAHEIGYIERETYHPIKLGDGSSHILPLSINSIGQYVAILYLERNGYKFALLSSLRVITFPITGLPLSDRPVIRNMAISVDNHLWIIYSNNQIVRVNLQDPTKLKTATSPEDTYPILAKSNALIAFGDYFYCYSQKTDQIRAFDIKTARFSTISLKPSNLGDITVAYVSNGALNIVTKEAHLRVKNDRVVATERLSVPTNSTVTFTQDFSEGTWFCTESDGIWVRNHFPLLKGKLKTEPSLDGALPVNSPQLSAHWWHSRDAKLLFPALKQQTWKSFPGVGNLRYVAPSTRHKAIFLFQEEHLRMIKISANSTAFFATRVSF